MKTHLNGDSTASRTSYLEASSRWAGVLAGDFDVVTNLDNFAEPTLAAASTKTMSLNNPLLAGLNLQKQTRHGKNYCLDSVWKFYVLEVEVRL